MTDSDVSSSDGSASEHTVLDEAAVPQEQPAAPEPTPIERKRLGAEPLRLERLDPASVTAERIAGWILTSVLLFAGLIGLTIVGFNVGFNDTITICCGVGYLLAALLLAWFTHVLPRKEYLHAGWCLTHCGLEIRRGVWWRSQISVPLARVQHTDVHQGPMQRRFGIAKLIVHTAGTENSAVELSGLNFATAQRLRDALIENRGEIDGV